MIYAGYDFYTNQYCGTMSDTDFIRLSIKASAYLDQVTRDRIRPGWESGTHADRIRMACCAVADAYLLNEQGGGVVAETVGKMTRNYAAGVSNTPTEGQRLYRAAEMFLGRTGLMYQGV